jgi:hypothetical protein
MTDDSTYLTPLALQENIPPKALALLQLIVEPNGWTDGLRFFA